MEILFLVDSLMELRTLYLYGGPYYKKKVKYNQT
jgi:hypothetical protein